MALGEDAVSDAGLVTADIVSMATIDTDLVIAVFSIGFLKVTNSGRRVFHIVARNFPIIKCPPKKTNPRIELECGTSHS